jgi:hypothetical protein
MNVKRTVTFALVSGALAAWFAGAMTPGIPPLASPPIRTSPVDVTGAELSQEINRLHERLRPDATPQAAVRNPFAFRSAAHARAATKISAEPVAVDRLPVPAADSIPITFSGLAEDAGPDGLVRTAIVVANGQLLFVKERDVVDLGRATYTVTSISSTALDLTNMADGSVRHLTLK